MDLALAGRLLASCAVIALVLAVVQLAVRAIVRERSHAGKPGGRLVNVLETTVLPNAASLHVVRVADRYVVIGRSAGHIATLCDVPHETIEAWRNGRAVS